MSSAKIFLLTVVMLYATANATDTINAFGAEIKIPKSCRHILDKDIKENEHKVNYCDVMPHDYPRERVDEYVLLMQKHGLEFHPENVHDDEGVYKPDRCDGDKNKNCCSSSTMRTPYLVYSESILKLVIQTNYFSQQIRSTQCRHEPRQPCFADFYFEQNNKKTECVTNMGSTKLYVFNPVKNITESVSISFPVSCSCSVSKI